MPITLAVSEGLLSPASETQLFAEQAAGGQLSRERIWVNVVYAADGAWGIAGRACDNAGLAGAIGAAALR